ncbi:MAG: hypothetical protein AB1671_26225 [Thermodesulfobacteriota bacterium]|jgi:hypothetical protein
MGSSIFAGLSTAQKLLGSWENLDEDEEDEDKIFSESDTQQAATDLPRTHPFEVRYTRVEKIDWESCRSVLENAEKLRILREAW